MLCGRKISAINGLLKGELCLHSSSPKRDYIYVLDVVTAIESCLNSEMKGVCVYNVGSGVSHIVTKIVELAKNTLRTNVNVTYQNLHRKSDVVNVVANISNIERELNWSPRFDFKTGRQQCVNTRSSDGKT